MKVSHKLLNIVLTKFDNTTMPMQLGDFIKNLKDCHIILKFWIISDTDFIRAPFPIKFFPRIYKNPLLSG